ncbi:kynureninase [Hoeflea marina]|uniref:Kynureninase n=1 Tax=Hoeflea marina TaxID=274592 RepID=A0A317PWM7_9HYPH|nr:kynureninase [Hoeflea marina]PWW03880.1 kynureninase [Hoeflea marina]
MPTPTDDDALFAGTRAMFALPDGVIYLDGNSLGPLPSNVAARVARTVQAEWGAMLIRAWNDAGWMDLSGKVGDRIGRLIGAAAGTVMVADTTSINLFKVLDAAIHLNSERSVVLSDTGNFPTDLYIAQGLTARLPGRRMLRTVAPEDVMAAIDDTVAVVMLTEVDYRTGRRHDMRAITGAAHDAGALVIWDLAHSAGALEVDLAGTGVDFAVGCGYKYLNGGPGAPAFVYVAPRHQDGIAPLLSGWIGHAAPFAFDPDYRPAPGIDRMRVGTPPVLSLEALDAALDVWDGIDLARVRARSILLTELFIAEVEAACPALTLASPRDAQARGSQVSFRHEEGFAIMQALVARGVIGDFRAPDVLRFGFAPLYVRPEDVKSAAAILAEVMDGRLWDRSEYRLRGRVT